jgi:hypothetical protein
LGEFSPNGRWFLLSSFLITKVDQLLGLLFVRAKKLGSDFDLKWAGQHFGPIFYGLIRSPCSRYSFFLTLLKDTILYPGGIRSHDPKATLIDYVMVIGQITTISMVTVRIFLFFSAVIKISMVMVRTFDFFRHDLEEELFQGKI